MAKTVGKLLIKAYDDNTFSISIDTKSDQDKCNIAMITAMYSLLENNNESNLVRKWIEAALLVKEIAEEKKNKKKKSK